MTNKKTPDNKMVPCCFKLEPKKQMERRSTMDGEKEKDKVKKLSENYILGSEKMPLDNRRYGYLPISIQKFLHTNNQKCQENISNPSIIKKNHPCMLR